MNLIKSISLALSAVYIPSLHANVSDYLMQINKDPNALYAFFNAMPKGGELHYHLAGGAYPETMLKWASTGDYCLDKNNFSVSKDTSRCEGVKAKDVMNQPEFYAKTVKSWSMKDFIPGEESGEDHFFSGFIKYMPLVVDFQPQLLAEIIRTAAQQQEQYLELMILPDNANSLSFGGLIINTNSFDEKRELLLANKEFQNNIATTVAETQRLLEKAHTELGCDKNSNEELCKIKIKFQYYMLREQPLDNLFAQSLNAFEAVSQSKGSLVGVNLVQPEDGIITLRDYKKQMEIFQYLHGHYPQVNIALHAGELTLEKATPQDLRFHIHDAIFTGNAQRIGHGVDIAFENDAETTMKYMVDHHLPVEINLISNKQILNVSGRKHPLNYYLAHGVPVVLSTDDEGVLRTDLTHQYVEAVLVHGLDYSAIKQINRNALTYAFLPGKSIWQDAYKNILVLECQDLSSKSCSEFIKGNEKGSVQWNLEHKLKIFEEKYNSVKNS